MAQDYKKFWDAVDECIPNDRGVFKNHKFYIPPDKQKRFNQSDSIDYYGKVIWKMWVTNTEIKSVLFLCKTDEETLNTLFDKLHDQKEQIEQAFGNSLDWNRNGSYKNCTISIKKSIRSIWDESQWAEHADWLIENIIKLEEVFREPLAQAFESFPNIQKEKGRRGMRPFNHDDKYNTPLVNHNPLSDNDDKPQNDDNDYSETMFLEEVHMTPEKYATLVGLLRRKKNIILQGAPGVGKTFAAKRLAFSIMGKRIRSV